MYEPDTGAALYRRGIYTFIKLTSPPPSMAIFDASNRDQCEVKRLNTNTPLQAFVMMNDPTVLEAARVLAQRLVAQQHPAEEAIAWPTYYQRDRHPENLLCRTTATVPRSQIKRLENAGRGRITGKKRPRPRSISRPDESSGGGL
jgi:hypothetical protein